MTTSPTLQEWTAAHSLPDANARRVQLALLHDRMVASRLPAWEAAVYLKRHVLGFMARWALMGTFALFITPWAWLPIIGIPAYGLYRVLRHG